MRSGKDRNSTRGRDEATADDPETAEREFAEVSGVVEREIASQSRDDSATERSEIADERDQIADERDRVADERERMANSRERSAAGTDETEEDLPD